MAYRNDENRRFNYWKRRPLTRRRFVGGAGVASAGVAGFALVGCGNDDDDGNGGNGGNDGSPNGNGNGNGGSASPTTAASTGEPVRGGTWRIAMAGDPGAIDPYQGTALPTHQAAGFVYSRLYRYEAGPGKDPASYITEPDLADGMPEVSDDGLTYVVKLRQDVKWHAPIDRTFDAEDVVYSWRRFTGEIPGTPPMPNAVQIQAYLDSVEAIDDFTVQFNLSTPRGEFLVSENRWITIMPRETGEAFDPSQEMVGTGPWIFESYSSGESLKYRRNPDWHLGPEAPYFDNVEIAIVPEYAARLNQFQAGQIDELVNIQGIDLGRVGDVLPGLQLHTGMAELPNSVLAFPEIHTTNEPWADPRVRRAVSMALNRDEMLDAAYNLNEIEQLGYDVERRWNTDVASFDTAYWLDPKGEYEHAAGDPVMTPEVAANFQYDPEGAKQLLADAGYPDGIAAPLYTTSSRYGEGYNTLSELIQAYGAQAGINFEIRDVDYSSVFITQIVVDKNYDGGVHIPKRTGIRQNMETYYLPGNIANYPSVDDPDLTDTIRDILADPDPESVRIKVLEMQNYTNDLMYFIPIQLGAAGGYTVYAPDVRNVLDYQVLGQDFGNETVPYYWREA